MRYLSVAWLLPLLLFGQSAEAARISFATENCGTPPLLGLEFAVDADTDTLTVLTAGGALCPGDTNIFPGQVSSGGSSLYGDQIDSIQFFIAATTLPTFEVEDETGIDFLIDVDPVPGGFLFTADFAGAGSSMQICIGDLLVTCIPDILIGIHDLDDYPGDATFRVIRVNDISVPEPTTLALLGLGLAAAAVRRRSVMVEKTRSIRGSSTPDNARRT